jgi:hypothetical protein
LVARPNLSIGSNFNFLFENKILLKIGPYFEIGHLVEEGKMNNWIWQGWNYENHFLIVPYLGY